MSQDVNMHIRDFQYGVLSLNHRQFLYQAFSIGILPKDPIPFLDACNSSIYPKSHVGIDLVLQGESVKAVSLVVDDFTHQRFLHLGLEIGLFPSNFLEYLEHGIKFEDFALEDRKSVELVMQKAEQAFREAFSLPAIQIEVSPRESFCQLMGQETVEIIVGEGERKKTFVVHKGLLMDKVSFFQKMFNSQFLESSTGSATLPEDSPEAFEVLIEWVYRSTLKTLHKAGCAKTNRTDLAISTVALAEKYLLPELGDRAMSFLAKIGENMVPTMSQMSTLYEQTPHNSNARIYAVREVEWALINPEAGEITSTSIHVACQDSDLLLDAIIDMRGKKGHGYGRVFERAHTFPVCDYHNHSKPVIALASPCPYDKGQKQTASQPSSPIKRTVKKKGIR